MKEKNEKKLKKWEKCFVFGSIIAIIIIIAIYAFRLVHYYKIDHYQEVDNTLATAIIKKGTVHNGDGLYTFDGKDYYYYGKDVNNYLWYDGRLWRIIDINDNGISLITDKSMTSLVWGLDGKYLESYVNKWLNNIEVGVFLNSLDNYQANLIKNDWCIGTIDLNGLKCSEYDKNYVGLLSIDKYLKAGGQESYLNNGEYWWTSNVSKNNKPYYIFNTGGVNDEISLNEAYYSYGVRPVITLSRILEYKSGDGSIDNPYLIKTNDSNSLGEKSIGEYVKYGNYLWRIQEKNDNGVKLIMNDNLSSNDQKITVKYGEIDSYLNQIYGKLNKNNFVKCDFVNGSYGKNSTYDFTKIYDSKNNNDIGIPSISEMFTNDSEGYWLSNNYNELDNMKYTTTTYGRLIANDINNKNYIRPVICIKNDLNIKEGTGLESSPYLLED